ncbi:protein DEFECTIVE IN MERISTEM SILENCING 3-like [Vicia villosa]|uniref:protein DEFECTIVE IN MERISTEM SILENCING 3-like n=1 Tax=Vicia villosa TaxID=3911 RepID=UPI00273CB15E|nr:protein DEFECTIVE IN MERISTEM SILENCING 3-like [Vicia villosa]
MYQPTNNSDNKDLVHTMPVSLQGTSASLPMDTKDNMQNEEFINTKNDIMHSQEMVENRLRCKLRCNNISKLQEDLYVFGEKIKQHEDTLSLLNAENVKLEDSIIRLQESSSTKKTHNAKYTRSTTEEEVLKQILQHEKSAAGVLCQMKTRHAAHASLFTLTKDVIGIVPLLGRVQDDNLSRLFSEYLGVETMLAIVCKTYEGVKAIEMYDKEGCINKNRGLHGLGATMRRDLDGRFLVICLESLRPYAGKYVVDDPQRKLDILTPRLPNGKCPAGFLGYAVNMIHIDTVCVTPSGFGLRETLFYNLFSRLQVYKTWAEMMQALPFITDGALSLDGGMIRSCGVFSLGKREDVNIRFPISKRSARQQVEIEKRMKDAQRKKENILEDIKEEMTLLDIAKQNFNKKKSDFSIYLDSVSSISTTQV